MTRYWRWEGNELVFSNIIKTRKESHCFSGEVWDTPRTAEDGGEVALEVWECDQNSNESTVLCCFLKCSANTQATLLWYNSVLSYQLNSFFPPDFKLSSRKTQGVYLMVACTFRHSYLRLRNTGLRQVVFYLTGVRIWGQMREKEKNNHLHAYSVQLLLSALHIFI